MKNLNNEEIVSIYEWVDNIPLSREKKFINKDFSDGILMAEVLKFLYPKLVDLHNYHEANSINKKIENWNTLNQKVFKKLNIPLSKKTIDDVSHSQIGTIENILKIIYDKISNNDIENERNKNKKKEQNKKDYKSIIYEKDCELVKLKKYLNKLNLDILNKEKENYKLKKEINQLQNTIKEN
jgi:hypothetical protein